MAKRQRSTGDKDKKMMACFRDLSFPRRSKEADYDAEWNETMTSRDLYKIILTPESAILFCARLGWIDADAPTCPKASCRGTKSWTYLYNRLDGSYSR